jgi:hypothetical protein
MPVELDQHIAKIEEEEFGSHRSIISVGSFRTTAKQSGDHAVWHANAVATRV